MTIVFYHCSVSGTCLIYSYNIAWFTSTRDVPELDDGKREEEAIHGECQYSLPSPTLVQRWSVGLETKLSHWYRTSSKYSMCMLVHSYFLNKSSLSNFTFTNSSRPMSKISSKLTCERMVILWSCKDWRRSSDCPRVKYWMLDQQYVYKLKIPENSNLSDLKSSWSCLEHKMYPYKE